MELLLERLKIVNNQSFLSSKHEFYKDYGITIGHSSFNSALAVGSAEIKEPTLEINGLQMIQFIFKGYNQIYETPDVFDNIDYLVINGMKFKRIKEDV